MSKPKGKNSSIKIAKAPATAAPQALGYSLQYTRLTVMLLEAPVGKHLEGNPDTRYKRAIAGYFEKVGTKVPWQKLGKDFKDEQFRFQVLDEGDSKAKDWQDTLRQVLATYRV